MKRRKRRHSDAEVAEYWLNQVAPRSRCAPSRPDMLNQIQRHQGFTGLHARGIRVLGQVGKNNSVKEFLSV